MDFPLPDINLRDISKLTGEVPDSVEGDEIRNLFDRAIDKISRNRSSSNLVIVNTPRATPPTAVTEKPTDLATNTFEPTKSTGDAAFTEKTAFVPKPPHSPKISPSSIPNPNPSVTVTKQIENTYPSYNNYLFSIPGYSAFQPVAYQAATNLVKPSETANQSTSTDFINYPSKKPKTVDLCNKPAKTETSTEKNDEATVNTDFENKFATEIITSITTTQGIESKLNITSLRQCSGATVTIPSQVDIKNKTERFSLMTSIPISKIDMNCVSPSDTSNKTNVSKKSIPFNPAFQSLKPDGRVEIQGNVVIKGASNNMDETSILNQTNNINSLINAAEIIHKNETAFWNLEANRDVQIDATDLSKVNSSANPTINPIKHDTKANFIKKPPDGAKTESNNQIVFLQNKTNNNPTMLVAVTQQQNNTQPQALPQKTTDSKNLEAPSRLSIVNEKCKEQLIKENGSSKVVSLKRLHHENCDEDDFENLITENQIYGNKIVVKERSQGILQEQDIKPRNKQTDGKNMVIQPNFLYVSNVQFPANVMMIKNSNKINQNITEQLITNNRIENKANNGIIMNANDTRQMYSKTTNNIVVSKDIHVLKSNNSVLQSLAGKQNKQDLIFQTNQNMIMNPQIIYQVPMLVESDSQKLGSTYINQSYSKFITQKKEIVKEQQAKQNEKLYIACPYQMDSKHQPKIVITNIRPNVSKVDEVSTLDIYEKRKKMRRLRQMNNRTNLLKSDPKKFERQVDYKNIITADNMKDEMCKEFAKTKIIYEDSISDSESDYERDELNDYADVIKEYSVKKQIKEDLKTKKHFLSIFKLGTLDDLKDRNLEKHERIIKRDAVAMACIAAGRIDKLLTEKIQYKKHKLKRPPKPEPLQEYEIESSIIGLQKKRLFLANLQLATVTRQYKEDYERAWQEIINERQRRNGFTISGDVNKTKAKQSAINSNDQLKLLSDIKHSVTENNNIIKRRLDAEKHETGCDEKSICAMAEKSFSELTKLSKMADRSMQILSGKDTKKRDLNPGFDSERIQKPVSVTKPPNQSQFTINIPNISKIISLRTDQENNIVTTQPVTQATSMDEPSNCAKYTLKYRAYNHIEIVENKNRFNQEGSDTNEMGMVWPGIDAIQASYLAFEAERKKQIEDVQRRNTQLRILCANSNRTTKREANLYRALNAERRTLRQEEESVSRALTRLLTIVNIVRNYQ